MKDADMVQVTYVNIKSDWDVTDTLEFDFFFLKIGSTFKMDIDITWGYLMVCEFSIILPNKVDIINYTSIQKVILLIQYLH